LGIGYFCIRRRWNRRTDEVKRLLSGRKDIGIVRTVQVGSLEDSRLTEPITTSNTMRCQKTSIVTIQARMDVSEGEKTLLIITCPICHLASKSTISPISTTLLSQQLAALSSPHQTQHFTCIPLVCAHRTLYNVSEACVQYWNGGPHGWYVYHLLSTRIAMPSH
jgi:hypothetical protein